MVKKAIYYTHPPQARQDAPLPERDRRERRPRGVLEKYGERSERLRTKLAVFFSMLPYM